MIYSEKIEVIFGSHAFDHSLFYQYENALRFELSVSGSPIEMFTNAWKKADEILSDIIVRGETNIVCWSFYGPPKYLSSLSAFRAIAGCGVTIPKTYQSWSTVDEDTDGNYFRHFICFEADQTTVSQLIWGALAQDLGIRPRLEGKIHIANLDKRILVHPYDDRGMDITSTNYCYMKNLYHQFNEYLLDYDRKLMDSFFDNTQ